MWLHVIVIQKDSDFTSVKDFASTVAPAGAVKLKVRRILKVSYRSNVLNKSTHNTRDMCRESMP